MEPPNSNQDCDVTRQLTVVPPPRNPMSWGGDQQEFNYSGQFPMTGQPPLPPMHGFNSGQFPMPGLPPHMHYHHMPPSSNFYYPPPPPPYNTSMMMPPPPPPHMAQQFMCNNFKHEWSTGLFDCFTSSHNVKNSTLALVFPCIAFGQIAEIVNEGETIWHEPATLLLMVILFGWATLLPCLYTGLYRMKMRNRYYLNGTILEDCLIHTFCPFCGLCQVYRELENHGFEVPLGWKRNKERHIQATGHHQQFVAPPLQEMSR